MIKTRLAWMLLPPLLLSAGICRAQLASIEAIDQGLRRKAEAGLFSGAVLIAKGDTILLDKGYGSASYPQGPVNGPETVFRIGSLTKQFTAAAILKLRDDGKLSLEDPICQYMRPCPSGWSGIRVSQLLNHTSGIPSYTAAPGYAQMKGNAVAASSLLALVESLPLEFEPGSGFDYSDSGYALLGWIVERVSGVSYAEYLKASILDPLSLLHTGYGNPPTPGASASGYVGEAGSLRPAQSADASVAFSSAGMYSTTDDLGQWVRALTGGRVISSRSQTEMFTPGPEDFGYGWIIPKNVWPRTYLHLGEIAGFESAIFVLPDLGVTSVVLSNIQGTDADAIAAANALAGAYAEFEGAYALAAPKVTLRVFIKGKTLTAQVPRRTTLPLDYVSGDAFVSLRDTPSELRVRFKRDASGQVIGVELQQFGKLYSGIKP